MKAAHARIQKVIPTEQQLQRQEEGRGFRDLYRSKGRQHRASSFTEWRERVGAQRAEVSEVVGVVAAAATSGDQRSH
jgi:hypothetical protein